MQFDNAEKVVGEIVDKIDTRIMEHLPFRVLAIMAADAMSMDRTFANLRKVAAIKPDARDEACGLYAQNAGFIFLIAWADLFKAGVIDEDLPEDLRKMIER